MHTGARPLGAHGAGFSCSASETAAGTVRSALGRHADRARPGWSLRCGERSWANRTGTGWQPLSVHYGHAEAGSRAGCARAATGPTRLRAHLASICTRGPVPTCAFVAGAARCRLGRGDTPTINPAGVSSVGDDHKVRVEQLF
jgi:hypothetical protein